MSEYRKDNLRITGPNLPAILQERIGHSKQVIDELLQIFDQDVELSTGTGEGGYNETF